MITLEQLYDKLGEAVPKFCPKCGIKLVIKKNGKIWVMPYGDTKNPQSRRICGFDCYCDNCEWSGNIEPDSLDVYYEVEIEESWRDED